MSLKKPPPGWNSWSAKPLPVEKVPDRTRRGLETAHACEWHTYAGSDDFDGCWA
jgi:hypothetical protein